MKFGLAFASSISIDGATALDLCDEIALLAGNRLLEFGDVCQRTTELHHATPRLRDRIALLAEVRGARADTPLKPDPTGALGVSESLGAAPAEVATVSVAGLLPLASRARLACLIAFGLDWMLGGSLMAILFSSAGPVYYERVTGDAVYAPLTEMLAAIHAELGRYEI